MRVLSRIGIAISQNINAIAPNAASRTRLLPSTEDTDRSSAKHCPKERISIPSTTPINTTSFHHPTITSNNQSNPTTPHSLLSTPPPNNTNSIKMAFFKSLIIASVAAVAFSAPQGASDKNTEVKVSGQDNSPKCGNGQKIACCNSGEDLIGLNCLSVPIRMSIDLSNSRITT
jgi:hypothetical protein